MRHLWQRIFAYSLILILLTQLAILLLHNYTGDQEGIQRFVTSNLNALAGAIQNRGPNMTGRVVGIFNHNSDRAWVIDANGKMVAGKINTQITLPESLIKSLNPQAELAAASQAEAQDAANLTDAPDFTSQPDYWQDGEVELWRVAGETSGFMGTRPVRLREGPARLYVFFSPPPNNHIWDMFLQGLLALTSLSGLLAFWMARSVSGPLRQLRAEVMDIANEKPVKYKDAVVPVRVTVKGRDEISDVALAVNHMADTLSRNVKSMRELVANVSHELRSPLARMQVALALLEESLPEGTQSAKAAQKAALLQEELDHMEKLIGTTLLSSKLDLQQLPPLVNSVAFSELCAEMARRQAPLYAKNGLDFTVDIEPELSFNGDETLLCNLVGNLLDNAVKYTEANGQVALRLLRAAVNINPSAAKPGTNAVRIDTLRPGNTNTTLPGGQNHVIRLEVENSHAPLPEDKLEQIFEPFNRGGLATGNGVGLGLSLVKKIAELHGGRAWAANTAGGFCFYVEFPLE